MSEIRLYSPIAVKVKCCGEYYETSPKKYHGGINAALSRLGSEDIEEIKEVIPEVKSVAFSVECKNGEYFLTAVCLADEGAHIRLLADLVRKIYAAELFCGKSETYARCVTDGHTEELCLTLWDSERSFVLTERQLEEQANKSDRLVCRNCKYMLKIANTDQTGAAICSFPESYEPTTLGTACRYLAEDGELRCGDCARLGNDFGCFTCTAADSAMHSGALCMGFIDKKEEQLFGILAFWKAHGMYSRNRITSLLDKFESEYKTPLD